MRGFGDSFLFVVGHSGGADDDGNAGLGGFFSMFRRSGMNREIDDRVNAAVRAQAARDMVR